MRDFICPNCSQHLAFENSLCLACGSELRYSLDHRALLIIARGEYSEHRGAVDAGQFQLCANRYTAECNWLVQTDTDGRAAGLCASCRLTRTRPNDVDTHSMAAFAAAEHAKRRLIAELVDLKLPIVGREEDPQFGLAFDLLSSKRETVLTGQENASPDRKTA